MRSSAKLASIVVVIADLLPGPINCGDLVDEWPVAHVTVAGRGVCGIVSVVHLKIVLRKKADPEESFQPRAVAVETGQTNRLAQFPSPAPRRA